MTLLAIPAGCQMLRTERWFWHPAGVRLLTMPEPGGIAPLDPRLPSGIPPGCLWPTSPPLIYSTENSEEPVQIRVPHAKSAKDAKKVERDARKTSRQTVNGVSVDKMPPSGFHFAALAALA